MHESSIARYTIIFAVTCLSLLPCSLYCAEPAGNLVENHSFEIHANNIPDGWEIPNSYFRVSGTDAFSGLVALRYSAAGQNRTVSQTVALESDIDYEFRSTVLPGIVDEKDIEDIGKWLKGAKRYFIQQFIPIKTLNESYMKKQSYTNPELEKLKDIASKYFKVCEIRGN